MGDWITGRNICRRHCMDLVSIETREENEFLKRRMINGLIRFFWTSGRKCNFDGCDRADLQPTITSGWFWSGSDVRLGSRNGKVGEICLHKRDKYQTRAKTNISAQIKRLYIENEQITALDL